MTTRVLRTIDKCGGLDAYVLGDKTARIKELGMLGWSLRWRVMRTDWYDDKVREEIAKMNLPPEVKSRLLVGLTAQKKTEKTVNVEQLEKEISEIDEQLEESGLQKDLGKDLAVAG